LKAPGHSLVPVEMRVSLYCSPGSAKRVSFVDRRVRNRSQGETDGGGSSASLVSGDQTRLDIPSLLLIPKRPRGAPHGPFGIRLAEATVRAVINLNGAPAENRRHPQCFQQTLGSRLVRSDGAEASSSSGALTSFGINMVISDILALYNPRFLSSKRGKGILPDLA